MGIHERAMVSSNRGISGEGLRGDNRDWEFIFGLFHKLVVEGRHVHGHRTKSGAVLDRYSKEELEVEYAKFLVENSDD